MAILVTGGAGYIGSHARVELLKRGCEAADWEAFNYYLSEGTSLEFSSKTFWFGLGAVAAGGLSYALDDKVDEWGRDHKNNRLNRDLADLGRVSAFGMLGASANRAQLRRTGRRAGGTQSWW